MAADGAVNTCTRALGGGKGRCCGLVGLAGAACRAEGGREGQALGEASVAGRALHAVVDGGGSDLVREGADRTLLRRLFTDTAVATGRARTIIPG